ncbi:hypothetical protein MYU51_001243 [Penicillium brevicompactum]|uniref:uncharacterized protein n=1 Tax=Penicillium brevicompactum TaxID=5074 RepID=UPI0025424ADF|nr:uncharacterized protein N7506_008893 [Penicillium brevicompactum]KAJ5325791.1 hypothetical protein N7506_008893 [Penicillium brevicompactum]
MLAQFVTAAKGLFTRHHEEHPDPDTVNPTNIEMVTSTRRGEVAPNMSANGKRKTRPASAGKPDGQETKRQRSKPQTTNKSADISSDSEKPSDVNAASAPAGNKIRFGSEEPEPIDTQPEEIPEASMEDEEDEDSDDDAPETINNSAQLSKMKEQAKKQEAARQLEEQLKKEKRRKLDERRKLQAKAKEAQVDDMMSESTTTLQGETTQDARRAALPALLPDDILNAEPVIRPPTPPLEDLFALPKKSNKLRFLDKTDKIPKDVNMGDVSIRVLDAPSSRKTSKPALPPRVSKVGRNVKSSLLQKTRTTARGNGLQKKASGPGGFVRR